MFVYFKGEFLETEIYSLKERDSFTRSQAQDGELESSVLSKLAAIRIS